MPKQRRTKRTILFEEYKKKILSGEMKPGDLFPSAKTLAPSSNVSQRTATSIIRELGLDKPIFKATASYGHFGRDEFPWEKCKELVM